MALRFHAWLGHKNIRYTVRYTVLSPTGSETSGTDRQCGIVAAINGPIAHFWLPKAKKFNDFSRAGVSVYVSGRGGHQFKNGIGAAGLLRGSGARILEDLARSIRARTI